MVPPRSILVIKPSSFGDVVHTLPAAARLKAAWPATHLTWVINPEWAPLLKGNGFVDEILPFPRANFRGGRGTFEFLRWSRAQLAPRRPELVIDYQGLFRSAWIGLASRGKRFIGMADAREGASWFYDRAVAMPTGVPHAVERYQAVTEAVLREYGAEASGGRPVPTGSLLPEGEEPGSGKGRLSEPFILVHPFARGRGKSLSPEQLERLCTGLAGRPVVIVGRQGDQQVPTLPGNVVNLLDQTTLGELISLIRRAAGVVTVDSGPSHLAALLDRPMVAIHTWSDPRRVGPYRPDAWVWRNGTLLQTRDLPTASRHFFDTPPPVSLTGENVDAIARLATSF